MHCFMSFYVSMLIWLRRHWPIGIFLCRLPSVKKNCWHPGEDNQILFIWLFTYIMFLGLFCFGLAFFFFPGLWRMEEHQSLPSYRKPFEAPANTETAISLSQERLLCNYCEKKKKVVQRRPDEKIVICLLKALLSWFSLDVLLTACRE